MSAGVADNFLHCKFAFYQVKLWGFVALRPARIVAEGVTSGRTGGCGKVCRLLLRVARKSSSF
jgi:hypothetical protein